MNLLKKSRILLFFLVIVLIAGFATYRILYKPHTSIEEQSAKFTGTSEDLLAKISKSAVKWEGTVVEISGKVTSKDKKGLMLNTAIYCQLIHPDLLFHIQENQTIYIKGRVIGYDDLLEELKLDKTIIIK
ncbi:hypothetical protein [Aquimarina sp. 2304DJ70-9]|uniref:hypothetical protein n=1 Tax=Aquimarina penaris TaxID=3231044 RepID=UPI0034617EDD